MFNALKHRNFRIYLTGQMVSLIGTWMQQLATSWIVYRMTASPLWLGISMFSTQIPMFLIGWMSGVWVDRADKRRILLWTQSLAALQAIVLAVLSLTGRLTLIEILALNLFVGFVNAIDMPARQSFVIQMIGRRDDLPNAIALNSSVMNGTRLVGPAIAGITIVAFGEGPCFAINAVSYIAVIFALVAIRVEHPARGIKHPPFLRSLREGIHAAYAQPQIRAMLGFLAFLSIVSLPYSTLFPALAAQLDDATAAQIQSALSPSARMQVGLHGAALHGATSRGATTLGMLTSTAGFGALIGAMSLAARRKRDELARFAGIAAACFSLSLPAIAWAHSLALTLLVLFVTGMSMMMLLAAGNTVIQTNVEDHQRGRVMALFSFALIGTAPFGSLLAGWLAQHLGLSWALTLQGTVSLVGTWAYLKPSLPLAAESSDFASPAPLPRPLQ